MNDPRPEVAAVARLMREAGWKIGAGLKQSDLLLRKGPLTYVAEVKKSEPRLDRLLPLLSLAILQARRGAAAARGAEPMAIVVTRRASLRAAAAIREFARTHAPDVVVGIVDEHGFRDFTPGPFESLNGGPSTANVESVVPAEKVALFSDLNQWMLKVLFAPHLDAPELLNAPLDRYRNASELARAARVSVMTAFRFIQNLESEGFLHESSPTLRLVRVDELLQRWKTAAQRRSLEIRGRWLLPGDRETLIRKALERHGGDACVGLFAAADAMGAGFVRGVPTHFYVPRLWTGAIQKLGVVPGETASDVVVVRVPNDRRSVFRGAVTVKGIRSTDVIQVWLDVSREPARGREQAGLLERRFITPMLKRALNG